MNRCFLRIANRFLPLLFVAWTSTVFADPGEMGDVVADVSAQADTLDESDVFEVEPVAPDVLLPRTCPPVLVWSLSAGYRSWSLSGALTRVAPYEDAASGMIGSFTLDRLGKDLKLSADARFATENDYGAQLDLNQGSHYRFRLTTDTFRHNLEYLPRAYGADLPSRYDYRVPSAPFAVDSTITNAAFRYRLPAYPLHANLGFWQFSQEGERQLRFTDHSFIPAATGSVNTILSRPRPVDSTVTELSASLDGHFGPLDAIYSMAWRQLDDRTSVPVHDYVERPGVRLSGPQEHNAIPESRFLEQGIALHTSMTGRVVGAVSYSLALRDNRGSLADTAMSERPSDQVQNGAADLNLTLSPQVSVVLRYRLLTVDHDGPTSLTNRYQLLNPVDVRTGVDLRKNHLTAAILYRPFTTLTIKGEYAGQFTHRSNVQQWPLLDGSSESHRGTLSVQARPVRGMRLRASYAYTAASSSTYGTSYDQRHDTQFSASYLAPSALPWGGSLSGRFLDERNSYGLTPYTSSTFPRERTLTNGTATAWVSPVKSLTLTGSYGFHRNDIDQTILLEMIHADTSRESFSYRGEVQLFGLQASLRPLDDLTLSAGYQNIHSRGDFVPDVLNALTSGIAEISRVDMREEVLSFGAEYRFSRHISCNLDYAYRDYDSRSSSLSDGSLHRITASLSSRW